MVLVELAILVAGLALVIVSSNRTVECATHMATKLKVPPLIIGVVLISVGTDIPEIANSILSSYTGHGDINVGDTLGSCLTQISLVLGIVVMLGGVLEAKRRNILVLGGAATTAVALAAIVMLDGDLTQLDAALLVVSYAILLAIATKFTVGEHGKKEVNVPRMKHGLPVTFLFLVLALAGVVAGAIVVVESVISVSRAIGIPEYFISFFVIGLGTSLPELSVELAAMRNRRYGLLLGDMMGSNITDATLALGIGPLLFPTPITGEIIIPIATYVVLASLLIVSLFAWRKRIDRKAAVILIALYLLSFAFLG